MTTYVIKTAALSATALDAMTAALPVERQLRAARLAHSSDQIESVAAAYLVFYALTIGQTDGGLEFPSPEQLLERLDEVAALAARFGWPTAEQGKPFAQGVDMVDVIYHVSLSHSSGLAAVAVDVVPIGIDVQRIPTMPPERIMRIASRFHPDEQAWLVALPETQLAAAFCRLWTCKESVLKLCGRGLSLPLSAFCIDGEGVCLWDGHRIRLATYALPDAFLSVAR